MTMSDHSDTSLFHTLQGGTIDVGGDCPICEAQDEVSEVIQTARIVRNYPIPSDGCETLGYAHRCSRGHNFRVMLELDRERDE